MKHYLSIALAYVGIIVGAGLSSGQDILQYFLSFGTAGIWAVFALGVLNVIFGKIIITLGCYYRSDNHQDVLSEISHPIVSRVIDIALVVSGFIIGFVMIAGAGANMSQQFGVPAWAGALFCSLLIIIVSFFDIDKITQVLGIFTPVIIVMLGGVAVYTFWGQSYDFAHLDAVARTIKPAVPNLTLAVINYYALCAMSGIAMAFVLGGSIVRIGHAEKGGLWGGLIIGAIIFCAAITLFVNIEFAKDAEIPMLAIVQRISPTFAVVYAVTIFALIFNTAFALFYAVARRFSGDSVKKMRIYLIVMVALGYAFSFSGFKQLVSVMYPVLGYIGMVLMAVLLIAWYREKSSIRNEKLLRRAMIRLLSKKYDDDETFTKKDRKMFHRLGERSVADTDSLKKDVAEYVKDEMDNP